MKLKNELEDIYEDLWNVYFCCYCLEPQGEKIVCCHENHFVEFKYLDADCRQEIAQEVWNG